MALLEARGLTVSYGGVHANDSINLDCHDGMVVGLIGPNGAGKTTFIDAITGFTPINQGTVTFDGVDLVGKGPDKRSMMGLTRTFQSLELFEDLSVRDNLLAAAERPKWYSLLSDVVMPRRHERRYHEQVEWALDAMRLGQSGRHDAQRHQPRSAQAGQRGSSARRPPAAGTARRTRRRAGYGGEHPAGDAPARVPGAQHGHVLDRSRHGLGAQRLRLHLRARLRPHHRPGFAHRGARQPGRDRCVPRRVRGRHHSRRRDNPLETATETTTDSG